MERRVAVHRCVRTAMHPPAGNTSVSTMDQKHVFYSALKHKMLCREARRVARCQTLSLGRGVVVSPRRLVRCRTHIKRYGAAKQSMAYYGFSFAAPQWCLRSNAAKSYRTVRPKNIIRYNIWLLKYT